jgi:hypothetical protein
MSINEINQKTAAARAGRAVGAMFFIVFGGIWLASAAYFTFNQATNWYVTIAAVSAALFALAYKRFTFFRQIRGDMAETVESRRASRIFNFINIAQWVLIIVVVNVLNNFGFEKWIIPAIIFIVGLHFIPLAGVFKYPTHYLTGTTMMLAAVFSPFIAQTETTINAIGCLAAGAILLFSALAALIAKSVSEVE